MVTSLWAHPTKIFYAAVFYVYGGIVACTSRTTGWVCAREIRGEEGGNIEKWESGCPTNPIVSNTTFGVLYTVYSSGDTVVTETGSIWWSGRARVGKIV
eukprot:scaffold190765_cov18-Tisochrysis_lutea.AAC.1